VRPPFTVIASRTTLVVLTWVKTPLGSSAVLMLCTLELVTRLSSNPPAWSPDNVRLLTSAPVCPVTDTP